jgi:hypothetical protein
LRFPIDLQQILGRRDAACTHQGKPDDTGKTTERHATQSIHEVIRECATNARRVVFNA